MRAPANGQATAPVAIVVGGATGIGRATADLLTIRGSRVLVVGLPGDDLDSLHHDSAVMTVAGDASDPEVAKRAVETAVATWGRLDSLVCCAGVGTFGTIANAADTDWDRIIRANLMTAIQPARHALRHLIEAQGTVVLISSLAGVQAVPASVTYTVTKHAVVGLARSMATDFGPLGVRTNVICPGPVRTAMFDHVMGEAAAQLGIEKSAAYLRAAVLNPRRQLATPAEIAQAVAFLAGPQSAAINGAVLMADGGISAADLSMSALHQPPTTPGPTDDASDESAPDLLEGTPVV